MISCTARSEVRQQTLENLARTDWGDTPLHLLVDNSDEVAYQERQTRCTYVALKESLERGPDYTLLLEDDLDFNRHIRHNLLNWGPVQHGTVTLASLYNPQLRELAADLDNNARIVDPNTTLGSQALLISKETVAFVIRRWETVEGPHGVRIPRLSARLRRPILVHAPSLIQHIERPKLPAPAFHEAVDFQREWTAQHRHWSVF